MRITNIDAEGYGVWSGLRIGRLSDSLNVFYGPNEAGKTTLLQFLRSMLYGFSPARQRYLPPVHGGRPGGTVDVAGPHGQFQISRYNTAADGGPGEQLTLTAPDGTRQGEHFIKVLLSNVDEAVFNNVFAIGLSEIQELATLSDTEAAQQLYSLTAGLDRVSLVEVLRELEASRNRILDSSGGPCQVLQLLGEHEKLRAEIEELSTVNHRYGRLVADRDQIHGEVTGLEEETNRLERLARVTDLAAAVCERWAQRAALDEQISACGPPRVMPEGAIERLDALNADIQKLTQHVEHLTEQRGELKREFAGLAVNNALWRQAARIEALKEQEPWIAQLQGQIGELETEIGRLSSDLAAECQRLGLGPDTAALPALSAKKLSTLRSPAKLLRQARGNWEEAKQASAAAAESAASLAQQIQSALSARGQHDLASAMDSAGNLVSQFRHRVQIDERLDQLARHQTELEERGRQLVDRQLLPIGAIVGLGAAFVVGVMLILAGLFMPTSITGSIGWGLAVLGLAGSAAAVVGKVMLERSSARRLEACQKQLGVLQSQVQQSKNDRDALDAQLPSGGGPIVSRLQAAERELAALEELAPLDTRRNAARQEADAATRLASEAEDQYKTTRRRWREALSAADLPKSINASQARQLAQCAGRITETQHRLAGRQEEIQRRRRELDSLTARIVQLAADAGEALASTGPIEQLRELAEAVGRQEAAVTRRDAIRQQARRLRNALAKREEAIGRLKHRRRQLLIEAGVKDEQEFRQRALECGRAEVLRRQRDAIAHEIEAVLASQCSEDAIRQQLEGNSSTALDNRRLELRQRLAAVQEQLHGLLEKRGRLSEQIEAIMADKRLASKHLDLAVLEQRLVEAIHRWQVLAATCRFLDMIRDTYERHRQPETLQEASGYLDRLTRGHYRRVWTPLGEHALRVDDAEGHALPVEALSRGTREQLFLSLRLALASSYARRGAPLPLVLDDVLVNFDSERAKAAAAVLRDFAAAGHQLIVFTCHEHILKLFKSLKVPVSRLPSNAQPGQVIISPEPRSEEKPKREKAVTSPRRKAAAKVEKTRHDDEPEDELPDDDDDDDGLDEGDEEGDVSLWEEDEGEGFDDDDAAAA